MTKLAITFMVTLFALLGSLNCYASRIAVEMQEEGEFTGVIGSAFVADDSIEVVTFVEYESSGEPEVVSNAFIYTIIEKKSSENGVYHVKCLNQLGVIFSGTINLKDAAHPEIMLFSDGGVVITNISEEGLKLKNKYIEGVYLGN